jgi:hypothetical protein
MVQVFKNFPFLPEENGDETFPPAKCMYCNNWTQSGPAYNEVSGSESFFASVLFFFFFFSSKTCSDCAQKYGVCTECDKKMDPSKPDGKHLNEYGGLSLVE